MESMRAAGRTAVHRRPGPAAARLGRTWPKAVVAEERGSYAARVDRREETGNASVDEALRGLVDELARVVEDHAPVQEADVDLLRDRLGLWERLDGLVTVGRAGTVRALSRAGAVDDDGASSTTEWLKTTTGRSGRDAARISRLATDLDDLPVTRAALASGRISAESADAVVRAARDGRIGSPEEVDATLADVASDVSPEHLRVEIKDRQQAADAAAMLRDENRQHARRSLRLWRLDTGMWRLAGDLPDELGQTFRTALDAFDRRDPDGTPPESRRRPEQRLCDALRAMTGVVLDGGSAPGTGGIVRPHLSVVVDAATVSADLADVAGRTVLADPAVVTGQDDRESGDGVPDVGGTVGVAPAVDDPRWADLPPGDLPWGGRLSPQAVRRLCCDAAVSRIVMSGQSQVLDVGRATRDWSGPQRRAINARDRGCRGPTCTLPIAWTSIHHVQWWSQDGPTSVDNGLALCHHCHHLVHDRGWGLDVDPVTATATWTSPSGTTFVDSPAGRASPTRRPALPGATTAGGVPASP